MTATATHPDTQPHTSHVGGWTLLEFDEVGSTNFVAGQLPPWHAVRADVQSAGRGRFSRSWVSDAGGLWLSAVVPTGPEREIWQALPLVAGLAVIESLKTFGIPTARLRWPNDVMVDDRKLAGLLVDKFNPQSAVVGMGVNVTNKPDAVDGSLKGTTTRMLELMPHPPSLAILTHAILTSLRSALEPFATAGLSALRDRINNLWGPPRRVTVDLDGVHRVGLFTGVDDQGRLLLHDDALQTMSLEPHQVRLLRELP